MKIRNAAVPFGAAAFFFSSLVLAVFVPAPHAAGGATSAAAGTARRPAAADVAPPAAVADATPRTLAELVSTTPADSLIGPLRRFEADRTRPTEAGEAAMMLGQLHRARGEYRPAAEAFARAAARLDPARKPEARLQLGLAWLALGETNQARAALDEVAAVDGPLRPAARLAIAQAWELARRPDRATEMLERLLSDDAGEAAPAALERLAVISDEAGRDDRARKLRERLVHDYPRSMEAAAARLAVFSAPGARSVESRSGAIAVVIGSFVDIGRARSLAAAAKSSGFPEAQVISQGSGLAAVHVVRVGVFPTAGDARRAADQAEKALGVAAQLARP